MYSKIKNKIEKNLSNYLHQLDRSYALSKNLPFLFSNLQDFVTRKGKKLRPLLFVTSYLGFTRKIAPRLYQSALAFEFLHDFLLIHDDIVDKSPLRRGKPSMHKMFDDYLRKFKQIKFNGQDLAILAGDGLYAAAMDTFLSIEENSQRKEKALKNFIQTAIYTMIGEFMELLSGAEKLEKITAQDIYRIYDYKTAYYTFVCPLTCGAILAGASPKEVNRLYRYGVYLGRAFQIKDDILGMFGDEKKMGKSVLSDLQEAKKTILIWHAYKNLPPEKRVIIRRIFSQDKVNQHDLSIMRKLITASGALGYAKKQITGLVKRAQKIIKSSTMRKEYKAFLDNYSQELLSL